MNAEAEFKENSLKEMWCAFVFLLGKYLKIKTHFKSIKVKSCRLQHPSPDELRPLDCKNYYFFKQKNNSVKSALRKRKEGAETSLTKEMEESVPCMCERGK